MNGQPLFARWLITVPMDGREADELEPIVEALEEELSDLLAKARSDGLLVEMNEV